MDSGAYYDEVNKFCYVGGGYQDNDEISKSVECYNFEKNKWNELPSSNLKHDMNPMIWTQDNNLLYIASVESKRIEYIDLRELKKWEYGTINLEGLFNTKFDYDEITQSRI